MSEAKTTGSTSAAAAELAGRHIAEIDRASMDELIACGRLYYAAINANAGLTHEELATLDGFDSFFSEVIARRRSASAKEFAAKVQYLLGRIQDEDLSEITTRQAFDGIMEDAASIWAGNALVKGARP